MSLYLRDKEIKALNGPAPIDKVIKILHTSRYALEVQANVNTLQTVLHRPGQSITLGQAQRFIENGQRIETESLSIGRASFSDEDNRGISILPRNSVPDIVAANIEALKVRLR